LWPQTKFSSYGKAISTRSCSTNCGTGTGGKRAENYCHGNTGNKENPQQDTAVAPGWKGDCV